MPHFPKPFFKKGRGVWYVEIDRKQENLGPDRDEAFRRYHEIMAKPRPAKVAPDSVLGILDSFLDWCSKHRAPDTYRWYHDRLQDFAGTVDRSLTVGQLRPYHVQQWVDSKEGWADGSRRNGIRAVKRAFKWAEEQGHIEKSPIAYMKKPKGGKREVIVSQDEFDGILSLAPDRGFRDLIIVSWETGCRPQESLIVEARHVDLVNQRWVFQQSEEKNREFVRIVYMTDRALEIVRRRMLAYPEGPLFRNSRGDPWTADSVNCAFSRVRIRQGRQILDKPVETDDKRRKMVYVDEREVESLAEKIHPGVRNGKPKSKARRLHEARKYLTNRAAMKLAPKYSLYALRHTWINRMLTSGVDALTVAILAGHQDPSTLAKHYQHLSMNPQHLLEQAKRAAG
jgi:integrase